MSLTPVEAYEQAIAERSLSEIEADLRERLKARGFNPDTWSDSDYKTAIKWIVADVKQGDESIRAYLARGGFLDTAEEPWLDLLVAGFFQIVRLPESSATIRLRLTDTSNTARSPFSGPLIAVWNPSNPDAALYFQSPPNVLVPQGGFVDVEFLAEGTGAKYNVAPGSITSLTTPIPGVAVSSPAFPGTASIVVTPGRDKESNASLVAAAKDKWSLLRRGWNAATIRAILRDVIPEATRVFVRDDNPLPGEAWVYMATSTGPVSFDRVVTATNYFKGEGVKPLSNKPIRFFASQNAVYALDVILYTDGSADAPLLAQQRLAAYMSNYPLGKDIYREALEEAFRLPSAGVQAGIITNQPAIIASQPIEAVQFTTSFTIMPASVLL